MDCISMGYLHGVYQFLAAYKIVIKQNNSDCNRDLKTTFILKSTLHNNFGDNDDYNYNSKYLHHLCFLINLLLHSHKMIFYFFHMQLEVLRIFNSLEVSQIGFLWPCMPPVWLLSACLPPSQQTTFAKLLNSIPKWLESEVKWLLEEAFLHNFVEEILGAAD